jgi:hypothetical protein
MTVDGVKDSQSGILFVAAGILRVQALVLEHWRFDSGLDCSFLSLINFKIRSLRSFKARHPLNLL